MSKRREEPGTRTITDILTGLTQPHPLIKGDEEKRRSSLIARITLVVPLMTLIFGIIVTIIDPVLIHDIDTIIAISGGCLFLFGFLMNHAGKVNAAAVFILVVTLIVSIVTPFFPRSHVSILLVSLLAVILTAFLFNHRVVLCVIITLFGI